MKIDKNKLSKIILKEIQLFEQDNALSKGEVRAIVDRLIDKLDSIDMSLDMIYGAIAQTDEPIGVTRGRQKMAGRFTRPHGVRPTRVYAGPSTEN